MRNLIACGYSDQDKDDICLLNINEKGQFKIKDGIRLGDSPSCLALHGEMIYAACESRKYARIVAMTINDGKISICAEITLQNENGLCHLLNTSAGLIGSCYGSGTFIMVSYDLKHILWVHHTGGNPHWAAMQGEKLILVNLGLNAVDIVTLNGNLLSRKVLEDDLGPRQWISLGTESGVIICEKINCVIPAQIHNQILFSSPPIIMPKPGYPAGACLDPNGRLLVPVRGSNTLVVNAVIAPIDYALIKTWPRYCQWIGDYLIICFQHSNCISSYQINDNALVQLDNFSLPGAAWVCSLDS